LGLFGEDPRAVIVNVEQEKAVDATAGDADWACDGSAISTEHR